MSTLIAGRYHPAGPGWGPLAVLVLLVGGLVVFILGTMYFRVFLEIILVIFKISDNVALIARRMEERPPEGPVD